MKAIVGNRSELKTNLVAQFRLAGGEATVTASLNEPGLATLLKGPCPPLIESVGSVPYAAGATITHTGEPSLQMVSLTLALGSPHREPRPVLRHIRKEQVEPVTVGLAELGNARLLRQLQKVAETKNNLYLLPAPVDKPELDGERTKDVVAQTDALSLIAQQSIQGRFKMLAAMVNTGPFPFDGRPVPEAVMDGLLLMGPRSPETPLTLRSLPPTQQQQRLSSTQYIAATPHYAGLLPAAMGGPAALLNQLGLLMQAPPGVYSLHRRQAPMPEADIRGARQLLQVSLRNSRELLICQAAIETMTGQRRPGHHHPHTLH